MYTSSHVPYRLLTNTRNIICIALSRYHLLLNRFGGKSFVSKEVDLFRHSNISSSVTKRSPSVKPSGHGILQIFGELVIIEMPLIYYLFTNVIYLYKKKNDYIPLSWVKIFGQGFFNFFSSLNWSLLIYHLHLLLEIVKKQFHPS